MKEKLELRPVDVITPQELFDECCCGCNDDGEWEVKDEEENLEDFFQIVSETDEPY